MCLIKGTFELAVFMKSLNIEYFRKWVLYIREVYYEINPSSLVFLCFLLFFSFILHGNKSSISNPS